MTKIKRDITVPAQHITLEFDLTYMGLVYGLGADFGQHLFKPLSEIKFQTATKQWVLTLGGKIFI